MNELQGQYQDYKATHKAQGNSIPSRPIISLLHVYGGEMSYKAFCAFSKLADDCQTEAEADLLASAIIIMIQQY